MLGWTPSSCTSRHRVVTLAPGELDNGSSPMGCQMPSAQGADPQESGSNGVGESKQQKRGLEPTKKGGCTTHKKQKNDFTTKGKI